MTQLDRWQALARSDPAAAARILGRLRDKLFVPHPGQREVIASEARFRILRAGRRWGKTRLAAHLAIRNALAKPNQMVWWVSNSDKNVRRGYRNVLAQLPPEFLAKPAPSEGANDRILTFRNGSKMEFYTAGSAGRTTGSDASPLTGEGVDFLIIDEAALITEMVWYQHLRPTLADTKGEAIIISTPRGRNWFWKLWQRGQVPGTPYESFHFTSYDNPYVENSEIEDAKATLPSLVFEQEYLAKFVQNAASIFMLPDEQVLDTLSTPKGWVVMGVDLAKKEDFTVLTACNGDTRMPVYYDRFNELSWPTQRQIIENAAQEIAGYQGVEHLTIGVDSTGLGDVIYDELDESGFDVVPINFGSGRQKELMVWQLAADIEHGFSFIMDDMVDEFESFEYEITDSGRYKFEAAEGHDDKVAAKMIENWVVVNEGPPNVRTLETPRAGDRPAKPLHAQFQKAETEVQPDSAESIMQRAAAWN
jgi:hypothetical protein